MTITTIKAAPHLLNATLALIEKSFHYESKNHFAVDFAPLMDESNHHNCFIKIDDAENVIAHVGVLERNIYGLPIAMLGGIAVDESRRGEGHFQELFTDVISEKRSDVALFLLWSDQEKLYRKFGFYLCGIQLEVPGKSSTSHFFKTKLQELNSSQKEDIRTLYQTSFSSLYTTVERSTKDWSQLEKITSADLYIKKKGEKISSYFFINKGQDLSGIIYEYGTEDKIEELVQEASSFGRVWQGTPLVDSSEAQYQFFMAPGDTKLFTDLIEKHTKKQILIRDINPMKQEVYFDFNEELLGLELEEFLQGVFGPGPFEELGQLKPLFISGLDSI